MKYFGDLNFVFLCFGVCDMQDQFVGSYHQLSIIEGVRVSTTDKNGTEKLNLVASGLCKRKSACSKSDLDVLRNRLSMS